MNAFEDKLVKFSIFLVVTMFVIPFLLLWLSKGTYWLINRVDLSIYDRYATDAKFEENIFFGEEIIDKTGIKEQLEDAINDLAEATSIQRFAYLIAENQNEVKAIISNNAEYQHYLSSIGCSEEDVINWSKKYATLDEKIIMACIYLTLLIDSFIMVAVFKFRKVFYVCAGIVYTCAMLSAFSDGVSDYLVANILSLFARMSFEVFTYRDMDAWKLIVNQLFKESTLTFIIFDTVVQIYQNNKKEKIEQKCRYICSSVEIQCSYLALYENISDAYIARMKLPIDDIVIFCEKNIEKCTKMINKKRLKDVERDMFIMRRSYFTQLEVTLRFFLYNDSEMYTTKEYISFLRKIQWLMYWCGISSN